MKASCACRTRVKRRAEFVGVMPRKQTPKSSRGLNAREGCMNQRYTAPHDRAGSRDAVTAVTRDQLTP